MQFPTPDRKPARPLFEENPGYEVSPKLVSSVNAAGHIGGARLASHLRGFSRQRRLEPAIVNLNDHLLETMESLRGLLGETISLALSLAGDLWTVRVNPIKIEIALLNLTINTRDAMPNGGALIIETRNVDLTTNDASDEIGLTPGEYVQLSVSDTGGCGDAQEVLARFEPFFNNKPVGRDIGRGLGRVYEFIKQSGGNATIYYEPGRGTMVSLYLPRSNEARESSDAPVTAAEIDNKISSVNRALLSLGRDSALRHRYLRERWQGCPATEMPSSSMSAYEGSRVLVGGSLVNSWSKGRAHLGERRSDD